MLKQHSGRIFPNIWKCFQVKVDNRNVFCPPVLNFYILFGTNSEDEQRNKVFNTRGKVDDLKMLQFVLFLLRLAERSQNLQLIIQNSMKPCYWMMLKANKSIDPTLQPWRQQHLIKLNYHWQQGWTAALRYKTTHAQNLLSQYLTQVLFVATQTSVYLKWNISQADNWCSKTLSIQGRVSL